MIVLNLSTGTEHTYDWDRDGYPDISCWLLGNKFRKSISTHRGQTTYYILIMFIYRWIRSGYGWRQARHIWMFFGGWVQLLNRRRFLGRRSNLSKHLLRPRRRLVRHKHAIRGAPHGATVLQGLHLDTMRCGRSFPVGQDWRVGIRVHPLAAMELSQPWRSESNHPVKGRLYIHRSNAVIAFGPRLDR